MAQSLYAVNLGQGFPNFDGPDLFKDLAIEAIRGGPRPAGTIASSTGFQPRDREVDTVIYYWRGDRTVHHATRG